MLSDKPKPRLCLTCLWIGEGWKLRRAPARCGSGRTSVREFLGAILPYQCASKRNMSRGLSIFVELRRDKRYRLRCLFLHISNGVHLPQPRTTVPLPSSALDAPSIRNHVNGRRRGDDLNPFLDRRWTASNFLVSILLLVPIKPRSGRCQQRPSIYGGTGGADIVHVPPAGPKEYYVGPTPE